jgi:hypothetical protein
MRWPFEQGPHRLVAPAILSPVISAPTIAALYDNPHISLRAAPITPWGRPGQTIVFCGLPSTGLSPWRLRAACGAANIGCSRLSRAPLQVTLVPALVAATLACGAGRSTHGPIVGRPLGPIQPGVTPAVCNLGTARALPRERWPCRSALTQGSPYLGLTTGKHAGCPRSPAAHANPRIARPQASSRERLTGAIRARPRRMLPRSPFGPNNAICLPSSCFRVARDPPGAE